MTNPSRPVSKGLEASSGASLNCVDSARSRVKPATERRSTQASVPPATITSASPSRIMRKASPIEWAPVAQAVETLWFGPRSSCRMAT